MKSAHKVIVPAQPSDWRGKNESVEHRGQELVTQTEAMRAMKRARRRGDGGIPFGGTQISSDRAVLHFLFLAAPGAAKTLQIQVIMQTVLPNISYEEDSRALISDLKRDALPRLAGMGLRCPVVTTLPYDARCKGWDVAADVHESPALAFEISQMLFEEDSTTNPFFPAAAIEIGADVMTSLDRFSPRQWDLRDFCLALRSKAYLWQILSRYEHTQKSLELLRGSRTSGDVMKTITTKTASLELIAACWHRAWARVSLREWSVGDFVLVLGNHETARVTLDRVYAVMADHAFELTLSATECTNRRSWYFLDELREGPKPRRLGRLCTEGRSKGACVVIAIQDIEGIRDFCGEHRGNEIAGIPAHLCVGRLQSAESAEWASRAFGEFEREESHISRAIESSNCTETTTTVPYRFRGDAILPSEFLTLPTASPKTGVTAYYKVPGMAWKGHLKGKRLSRQLIAPNPDVPDLIPRPKEHYYLEPWSEGDLARLGVERLDEGDLEMREHRPRTPPPDSIVSNRPEKQHTCGTMIGADR